MADPKRAPRPPLAGVFPFGEDGVVDGESGMEDGRSEGISPYTKVAEFDCAEYIFFRASASDWPNEGGKGMAKRISPDRSEFTSHVNLLGAKEAGHA